MNCQEIKLYFENISPGGDPPAELCLNEHIAGCPQCSRFVEGQTEVRAKLALLRESVSSPSSALDAIVLANYRKQVLGPRASADSGRKPKSALRPSIRWAFGLAAAMALVAILLWPRKQSGVVVQPETMAPVVSSTRLDPAAQNIPVPQRPRGEKGKTVPKRAQAAVSSASIADSSPEGFRSLMYCDELSCGGAMDVVRIELQPSDAGLMAAAPQSGNVVSAEVLVGADGVARGIRIVR